MPDWLTAALDPGNAEALLTEHIAAVVGRYAGTVVSWDVVNEPVERNDRRPDGLRKSPWLRALGPDYIEVAFRAAHAADPSARLALADYGLEYDDEPWMVEKRGTMLALLRGLLAREVPIHALALQGHLLGDRPPAFGKGLAAFLAEVASLGLDIYVTELDVDDQHTRGSVEARDRAVADIYGRFLETVLAQPAVKIVVTWGLSDRYTSKITMFPRPDGAPVRPLPFDVDLRPKPAALALARAFG
jgi:endo-1,4-beta-xylanase